MSDASSKKRDLYLTGVRNLHAAENQAVQQLSRQVERLENYPELESRLRQHIDESKEQAARLEAILKRHDADTSGIKEAVTGAVGNVLAAVHSVMQDEVLKNHFTNYGYENYEVAAYTSLIAMAEAVGDARAVPVLQKSLLEERDTAEFLERMIGPVTLKYMELEAMGAKAGV